MTQKRFMKMLMANGVTRNAVRIFVRSTLECNNKRSGFNHEMKLEGYPERLKLYSYKYLLEDCLEFTKNDR